MKYITNKPEDITKDNSLTKNEEWIDNQYNPGYYSTEGASPPINDNKIRFVGYSLLLASIICFITTFLEFHFWFLLMGILQFLLGTYIILIRKK